MTGFLDMSVFLTSAVTPVTPVTPWVSLSLCQSMSIYGQPQLLSSFSFAASMQLPWVSSFYASFYFYVFLFVADAVASKVPVTEEETAGLLQLQPVEPLEALEAPVAQTASCSTGLILVSTIFAASNPVCSVVSFLGKQERR